jgi:hypothetical protein
MSKSKIYCGIGEVPKGMKKGTMKECMELGQVRLYGLYKIDSKIVSKKSKPSAKEKKMTKNEVKALVFKFKGRITRIEEEIKNAKPKEKTQLEKDLKEANKEKERYIMIFKKMEDGISIKVPIPEEKKPSKKDTKKSTKKDSKKTPAKKTPKKTTKK